MGAEEKVSPTGERIWGIPPAHRRIGAALRRQVPYIVALTFLLAICFVVFTDNIVHSLCPCFAIGPIARQRKCPICIAVLTVGTRRRRSYRLGG